MNDLQEIVKLPLELLTNFKNFGNFSRQKAEEKGRQVIVWFIQRLTMNFSCPSATEFETKTAVSALLGDSEKTLEDFLLQPKGLHPSAQCDRPLPVQSPLHA